MLENLLANWPLKLLALIVAFGIWASIATEGRTVRDFTVPLELRLAEDLIPSVPPPTTVDVRLEGPASAIRRLDPLRLAVRLDLPDVPLGDHEVSLSETHLSPPHGIDVTLFEPARVEFSVDRKMRRELAIAPEVVGDLPAGHAMYSVVVNPVRMVVEGPESEVGGMTSLRTDPVSLEGRTETFSQSAEPAPEGSQVRVVDAAPVVVRVIVDAAPTEVTFGAVPLQLVGQAFEASADPGLLAVTLAGPPALLESLSLSQIQAVADLAGVEPAEDALRLEVHADLAGLSPDQLACITVKSIEPTHVSVRLTERSLPTS